jgi:hypothetical protein
LNHWRLLQISYILITQMQFFQPQKPQFFPIILQLWAMVGERSNYSTVLYLNLTASSKKKICLPAAPNGALAMGFDTMVLSMEI